MRWLPDDSNVLAVILPSKEEFQTTEELKSPSSASVAVAVKVMASSVEKLC